MGGTQLWPQMLASDISVFWLVEARRLIICQNVSPVSHKKVSSDTKVS